MAGEPELVGDLMGDFFDGPAFGIDEHVRQTIDRLALGEEALYFFKRIGVLKEGTVRLVADALPNHLGAGPEADRERVGLELGEVEGVGSQAAAGRDHGVAEFVQAVEELAFVLAEARLAFFSEDFANSFSGVFFYQLVGIHKSEI